MRLTRKQPGFFDIEERTKKLTQMGDPLIALNAHVDWEAFRADLNRVHFGVGAHGSERKSHAGAKPIDVVLKFKILVLQQLHNLSDDRIEYQIRDRLSFMRFLGLQLEDRVPDAKTVWLFREQIKAGGLMEKLFARFHEQLAAPQKRSKHFWSKSILISPMTLSLSFRMASRRRVNNARPGVGLFAVTTANT